MVRLTPVQTRVPAVFFAVSKVPKFGLRVGSYSVVVSTRDSDSLDPGSNPGRTFVPSLFVCFLFFLLVTRTHTTKDPKIQKHKKGRSYPDSNRGLEGQNLSC